MGDVVQDPAGEPQTGQEGHRRLVSSPSAPTGQGAARRAQSTRARPLQRLRRQRQLPQYAAARRSHEAGLVQMAVPSQPAHALDVGEVWRLAPAVPSPPPTDYGPHLGRGATSHINGRAGWWKSPCPDLARGRGGKPPGLLYNGRIGNSNGLLAPPPRPHPPAPPAGQPGKGAPGMRPPTPPGVPSFCEFSLRTEGIDLNTVHMCSIIVDTSSHTHHLDVVRRVQSWRLLLPP